MKIVAIKRYQNAMALQIDPVVVGAQHLQEAEANKFRSIPRNCYLTKISKISGAFHTFITDTGQIWDVDNGWHL